jgi:hypothetical protein
MRDSTLKAVAGSLAAVVLVVSLGTSPVLARGGGGHGGGVHFGGGGFGGGGFHPGGGFRADGGFHPGDGYRVGGGGNGGYYGHNHDYGGYGGYDACALNPFYLLNPGYPYSC